MKRSREYSDDDIADLYSYAIVLGDTAAERRWRTRLVNEAPEHRVAKGIGLSEILRQAALDTPPVSVLSQLDSLWEEGGLERILPVEAFRIALQTDDIDAMGRWLDRLERATPSKVDDWVTEWIVATAGGEASVQRMETLLGQLEEPGQTNRALYWTADEQLRDADRRRQVLGGRLGQVLTEKGEIADGLEYLRLALDRGWNVDVFSRAAEIYLNLADTTTAFKLLARIAVDSWADTAVVDSIVTAAQAAIGRDQWKTMVSAARATLAEYYLDGASPSRFVTPDIRVQDGVRTWHTIGDLTAGHTTILAFWSRHDLHARQDISRLGEASRRAATHDARVIALVQEPPSSDWDAFVEANQLQFSVYHDVTSAMVRELEVWGYKYFVVDGSGMVRFSYTDLDKALNQAAALHYVEMLRAATPFVSEESDRLP